MPKTMLTDKAWEALKQILKNTGRVYNKYEHRNTLEGILYRMRTGVQWRDLPEKFGRCIWSKKGVLQKLFQSISSGNDPEWLFIDGSIVKAQQASCGAASCADEAIGKSRGGNSTKIHLAVDSGGLPVYFEISGGQVYDIAHAQSLIAEAPKSSSITADKDYDSDRLRAFIEAQGSVANIPRKENSKTGNGHMDWCLYKYRHLVENAFYTNPH
jgi:transposase